MWKAGFRALFLWLVVVGGAVVQPVRAFDSKVIFVDGSSTVAAITQAVAAEFSAVRPDIRISVGVSGTSGGFRRFLACETDICDASRAIKAAEIEQAKKAGIEYIELLVGLDGIVVSVSRNTKIFKDGFSPCMTLGELELLWSREAEGLIINWSQLGSRFADAPIVLSGAASTSGTFDWFTSLINEKEGDTRSDYFATEEDQLLAELTGAEPYGLTYFGFAYLVGNQDIVQAVAIDPRRVLIDTPPEVAEEFNRRRVQNGKLPLPVVGGTPQGVLPMVDTISSFSYPLSRPLFIYVKGESGKRPAVDAFVDFYLSEDLIGSDDFMLDVGYVPVYASVREAARIIWENRITGTAFGGKFSELAIGDIIAKYRAHALGAG